MNTARWCALVLLACAAQAHAQYKYVGPDGTVTYSDQPPPATAKNVEVRNFVTGESAQPLPFEVRQAMQRFPVTMYTTANCDQCAAGRKFMRDRGVPFTEKTVNSPEELIEMKRQTKETNFPVLVVGRQHFTGFSDSSWASLLDEANYPAHNTLPPSFQESPPEPLLPQTAQTQTPSASSTASSSPSSPPATAGNAPPGFHF